MQPERYKMNFILRPALLDERPALEALIALSARGLSQNDYSAAQIEAALGAVFGVDSDLIADGTYLVAEHAGTLVGCGGWSKRKTLFGSDRATHRSAEWLDPSREPAKIRAFFVHPAWARQGIGRLLLAACETAARAHGFEALELMATLPGLKLYRAMGFIPGEPILHPLTAELMIEFVPMHKSLRETT